MSALDQTAGTRRSHPLHSCLSGAWKVLFPVCFLILLGVSLSEHALAVPFLFFVFVIIGSLTAILIAPKMERKPVLRLFILVYALNVIAVIFFMYAFQLNYGHYYLSGGTDDMHFDNCAHSAADSLKSDGEIFIPYIYTPGFNPNRFQKYRFYISILADIYYASDMIAGDMHTLNVRLFNSLTIGMIAVFTYLLCRLTGLSQELSFVGGLLAGTYPSQMFWGAVVVRDSLVVLFSLGLVLSAWKSIILHGWMRFFCIILGIILTYLIAKIRMQSAVLVLGSIGCALFVYGLLSKSLKIRCLSIWTAVFAAVVFVAVAASYLDVLNLIIQTQTEYRMQFAEGLSQYVFGLPFFPIGMIVRPFYALISPFPSLSLNPQYMLESIGTVSIITVMPMIGYGFFYSLKDRNNVFINIVPACFLIGISWTTFHARHLLMHAPFLFLLFAYGWEQRKNYTARLLRCSVLMDMALVGIYCGLKLVIMK